MPTRAKFRWWFGGAAVVLLLILAAINFVPNPPPLDDADLTTPVERLPAEQNAYEQLLPLKLSSFDFGTFAIKHKLDTAGEYLDSEKVVRRRWRECTEFFTSIAPLLIQADDVLARHPFQLPSSMETDTGLIVTLNQMWTLRGTWQAAQGHWPEALADARRLLNLAHQMRQTTGRSDFNTAAFESSGLGLLDQILQAPGVPRDVLVQARQALALHSISKTEISADLRRVYDYYKFELLASDAGPLRHERIAPGPAGWRDRILTHNVNANRTLKLLADSIHGVLLGAGPTYAATLAALPSRVSDRPSLLGAFRPNAGGQAVLQDAESQIHEIIVLHYHAVARTTLLEAGFAARLYWDDHRALPPTLAGLVPQYLPAIPTDPFDGKPLRYDASRSILWSVGDDLKDSGGSSRIGKNPLDPDYDNPLSDSHEPTLELKFARPAPAVAP